MFYIESMSIFIVAEGTHGGSKLSYEIDILLNKFDLQNKVLKKTFDTQNTLFINQQHNLMQNSAAE